MKIKKSVWLPAIIFIYFVFMSVYFGADLLRSGQSTKFYLTCAMEVAVLIALVVFLRKRENINNK